MFVTINLNIIDVHCPKNKEIDKCPALKYLDRQCNILYPSLLQTGSIGKKEPELLVRKDYNLELDAPNIAEKIFTVLKKAKMKCARCQEYQNKMNRER